MERKQMGLIVLVIGIIITAVGFAILLPALSDYITHYDDCQMSPQYCTLDDKVFASIPMPIVGVIILIVGLSIYSKN